MLRYLSYVWAATRSLSPSGCLRYFCVASFIDNEEAVARGLGSLLGVLAEEDISPQYVI